jgi:hypothetical protein
MHASIEELLSLRDGEPVAQAVTAHVAACAQCGVELDRLRRTRTALAALPLSEPAPASWAQIVQRAAARPSGAGPWLFVAGFGVAAAVMVLAVLIAHLQQPAAPAPLASAQSQAPARAPDGATPPATNAGTPVSELDTDALMQRSRRLEAALAAMSYEPRVVNAGTAATIATLEDHLAYVDYRLSMDVEDPLPPEQSRRLWQQRVDLMDSLVNVRYAQLQRIAY